VGRGLPPVVPDLVVEVYSPSNTAPKMREKLNEYLNAGVPLVWIVHPGRHTVAIYRPDEPFPTLLGAGDVIEDLPELPGFRCRVADFFV
jgi:Uma2 family endonuclease